MKIIFEMGHLWGMIELSQNFGQHVKPIISKGHSKKEFWFFHQILFLAFNSKDITMLWILNLFSRSRPTKLRKRIFDKMSQKKIFDTQSWQVVRFSHIDSVGNVKFGSEMSMKTFFQQKFFMFINSMRTCFSSSRDCGKLLKLYSNYIIQKKSFWNMKKSGSKVWKNAQNENWAPINGGGLSVHPSSVVVTYFLRFKTGFAGKM